MLDRDRGELALACLADSGQSPAPYGGANEEEILVHFGMTQSRFIERLWQVIPESNCAQDEIRNLANAYPHQRAGDLER
ncbi:hypothetical protein [Rhodococcus sp. A14]|uniref:hypothetical protein n=1 Tax=Rhodococcus sp. A14 TaxID=1194106 RepID=UPI0032163815